MIKKEEIEKLALSIETAESAELAARLGAALGERFGVRDETPFSILARGEDGALIGGINGLIHWRWAYVRHLWVAESRRGRGLGARLMGEAERLARDRGCVGVYIDTFEKRVAAFYESLGFARVGEIADFPPGHSRISLSKRLDD
ncbi:MAG: N-acetyltransferase GCN5 [Methylocystaceae bacterium]|nr:MAG: N-acetyltransferase GCN5 [Methylocystaceae bacterium]